MAIELGEFDGVLQTLDTTALEPDIAEYKYYAPDVGLVLEEALDAEGDVESTNALLSVRTVGTDDGSSGANGLTLADLIEREPPAVEEPEAKDFPGDGAELNVTFLGGEADLSNALGAYIFDTQTGQIGDGRILFTDTADLAEGTTTSVKFEEGEGLRLFLVPRGPELGLDLSDYEDGGLFFTNFLTGEAATLSDDLAPLVTDEAGELLPVTALHALDDDSADGFNFLNPAAGVHATDADTTVDEETEVLGFEELLTTDPTFDGDYDDVLVAVSEAPLGTSPADALLL